MHALQSAGLLDLWDFLLLDDVDLRGGDSVSKDYNVFGEHFVGVLELLEGFIHGDFHPVGGLLAGHVCKLDTDIP